MVTGLSRKWLSFERRTDFWGLGQLLRTSCLIALSPWVTCHFKGLSLLRPYPGPRVGRCSLAGLCWGQLSSSSNHQWSHLTPFSQLSEVCETAFVLSEAGTLCWDLCDEVGIFLIPEAGKDQVCIQEGTWTQTSTRIPVQAVGKDTNTFTAVIRIQFQWVHAGVIVLIHMVMWLRPFGNLAWWM